MNRSIAARFACAAGSLALVLSAAACDSVQPAPASPSAAPATSSAQQADMGPATEYACQQFFGDPDFSAPAANEILAMGANALEEGARDPEFFASNAQSVNEVFAEAESSAVKEAAAGVAQWFTSEPAKGEKADLDALEASYRSLANECAPVSVGAAWESGTRSEAGTKPAALVCSHMAIQPQTFTHFRNSNVLTSNMFKLVGLGPKNVEKKNLDRVEQTNALLEEQKKLVDDPAVRDAIGALQKPFQDALDGDRESSGLKKPLVEFGQACDAAGFPGAVELSQTAEGGDAATEEESELP